MKFSVVSFDVQGTLTDTAFSDEFWFEMLPRLYVENNKVTTEQAKTELKDLFEKYGRYDERYYSVDYWLRELHCRQTFEELVRGMRHKPEVFDDMMNFVTEISKNTKVIATSSTTQSFIKYELNGFIKKFDQVFSAIDDFNIFGKPPILYQKIAERLEASPEVILHIGDSREMDVKNARQAGCLSIYFDRSIPRSQSISNIRKFIR